MSSLPLNQPKRIESIITLKRKSITQEAKEPDDSEIVEMSPQ